MLPRPLLELMLVLNALPRCPPSLRSVAFSTFRRAALAAFFSSISFRCASNLLLLHALRHVLHLFEEVSAKRRTRDLHLQEVLLHRPFRQLRVQDARIELYFGVRQLLNAVPAVHAAAHRHPRHAHVPTTINSSRY